MEKSPEVSDRIKALRSKLGMTQKQLSEALGISQQAVSGWETVTADSVPSAEAYARMGNLAPYPDALWFWQQAGISEEVMLSAASQLLAERGQKPPEGATVTVPHLRGQSAGVIYVDARAVPDPASVGWIDFGGNRLIDTSANNSLDLQPFWDWVVFLETPHGLRLERLTFGPFFGDHILPIGEHTAWSAFLRKPHEPTAAGQTAGYIHAPHHPEQPGSLGGWKPEMADYQWRMRARKHDSFDAEMARAKAREDIRLKAGYRIVGRVLDHLKWVK